MSIDNYLNHLEGYLQSMRVQMMSLLSVTRKIGSKYNISDLYRFYEDTLTEFIEVEDISLLVYEDSWKQVVCKSKLIPKQEQLQESIMHNYRDPSRLTPEDSKNLGGYTYIIPVYYKGQPVSYTLLGEFNTSTSDNENDFLLYAKTLTNMLTIVIENKKLINKEIEKKDLEKDLEMATKIQGMIIPKRLPQNSMYEFAGIYRPHKSIGGDYYDVINLNKDEFVFCIGDISGKGVAAALVMASLQAYLNAGNGLFLENNRELVDRLNDKIYSITDGEKFITLFLARYNIITRELQYLNAGHNPPVLINGGKIKRLKKGCAILGILDYIPRVDSGKVILEKNAMILTYTDGLTEQENELNQAFGDDILEKFVDANKHLSAEKLAQNIYQEMLEFKGQQEIGDDVSILAGKFF